MRVLVIGQIGRDLVLRTDGANQAVGLVQLGVPVALIGVVGDDIAGTSVLEQAERDLVQVADLDRSASVFDAADTVSIQLQQPPATALEAARRARRLGQRGWSRMVSRHPTFVTNSSRRSM